MGNHDLACFFNHIYKNSQVFLFSEATNSQSYMELRHKLGNITHLLIGFKTKTNKPYKHFDRSYFQKLHGGRATCE